MYKVTQKHICKADVLCSPVLYTYQVLFNIVNSFELSPYFPWKFRDHVGTTDKGNVIMFVWDARREEHFYCNEAIIISKRKLKLM
jgi:hypothetical protein